MSHDRKGCATLYTETANPLEMGLCTDNTALRPGALTVRESEGAERHSVGTVMARELSDRSKLSEKSVECKSSSI